MKTYLSQLRFALQYIADRKWNYIPALLGVGIGYSGMSISVSLIPQILIDSAAAGSLHGAGRGLAVYAGLFVLSSLLAVLSQYAYRRTALRAAAALRLRIMEKKTRLPMSFLETSHSGERIDRFLKEPEEEIRIPASSKTCRDASAFLVFQDVSFSYPRPEKEAGGQTGQKNILEHFDLKIRRNETLLLSGPSGCGKSTLFRLLLGFYNVSSGAVLIDGKYLDEYSPQELRGMISLIPQKPFLFQGTILENIRCARPEASEEEVKDAAKAACAHDFITALPSGYDHVLTEQGRSLSFGQRQRIAIARAFLKDAPIILFDEASSGLDNESERAILESVHTLIRNKTAIIIAHRNADAWNADRKYFFTISH